MHPALLSSRYALQVPIAALPPDADFREIMIYQLSGIGVVLFSLAALWLLCEGLARVFRAISPQATVRLSPPAAQPELEAQVRLATGIEPEIAVVIAAAVTTVMGPGCRVVDIKPSLRAPPLGAQLAAWTMQGRLQHHTSHTIR